MIEPEKGGGADPKPSDSGDYVGWIVKLEITHSHAWPEDPVAKVEDSAHIGRLEDVLRLIEADFRQLTVPLLGRSERVLPCRAFFRLRKVRQRWERLLHEQTGDTFPYRVRVRFEPGASDPDGQAACHSDLKDQGPKTGLLISVEGKPISGQALLGRFHPDHPEPNIFDAIEYARRLEAEQRKDKGGGA